MTATAIGGEVQVWRAELGGGGREAARRALREVLARYLGTAPEEIELESCERGKPRLAGRAELRFSLSHSGELALVAVALGREVGVDVERIAPRRDLLRLAGRALDPAAAAAVRAAPPAGRLATFHAAWARREAVAKCHGVGLWAPLPEAPVEVAEVDPGLPGYAAAVALAGCELTSPSGRASASAQRPTRSPIP